MKNKTLLILAAGMGSRFGGPKQLFPVGPNNEFIMDYSIYSAIKYGFNKVVFVTRKELVDEFKNTIGKRLEGKIKVEYAIQTLDFIPDGFTVPQNRTKPWGTAHAIYCAKDYINEDFAVITSDDFFGDEAFKDLSNALDKDEYSIIGYKLGDTLSANGAVNRGVVISHDGVVEEIIESVCELTNDKVLVTPKNNVRKPMILSKDNSVSMLMYSLKPDIFKIIEANIKDVFIKNKENLDNFEFYIPDVLTKEIKNGRVIYDVPTRSRWIGLTYHEDLEKLKGHIQKLINENIYPNNLWK